MAKNAVSELGRLANLQEGAPGDKKLLCFEGKLASGRVWENLGDLLFSGEGTQIYDVWTGAPPLWTPLPRTAMNTKAVLDSWSLLYMF